MKEALPVYSVATSVRATVVSNVNTSNRKAMEHLLHCRIS